MSESHPLLVLVTVLHLKINMGSCRVSEKRKGLSENWVVTRCDITVSKADRYTHTYTCTQTDTDTSCGVNDNVSES